MVLSWNGVTIPAVFKGEEGMSITDNIKHTLDNNTTNTRFDF